MKAIAQDRYGSTDALALRDVDPPTIRDEEVLVRVHAAGVDAGVWHLMTGLPYLVRIMGFGLLRPKSRVRGMEFAGRVEAAGSRVRTLRPGDEVFGVCDGSFAEYARAREDRCAPRPANVTFEQAASVPISGCAALHALREQGRVEPGQRVLIIGAGGGVGTFAVQLAKAFGAEVTGVCSASKEELVRSLGADRVIDYTRADFADGVQRWDLVVDTAGNRTLSHLRRALAPRGTLVIVGGHGGGRFSGGVDRQLRALLVSPFVGQRLRGLFSLEPSEDLRFLKDLIEAGKVTPVVGRTYPLSEVPAAIRYVDEGHAAGKVVVSVLGALPYRA